MRLNIRLTDGILLLEIINAPVNALSLDVRRELYQALTVEALDPRVFAVILTGRGKYFCAGGDLRETRTALASAAPRLSAHILPAIEQCAKPVIAALHGAAIGGGFELALACHYRVALADTVVALPEITHGIIPLSGSIRLPRIWGVGRSVRMILSASRLRAGDMGGEIFDSLVGGEEMPPMQGAKTIQQEALRFAHEGVTRLAPLAHHSSRLLRHRPPHDVNPCEALADALAIYGPQVMSSAQLAAVAAIRAGIKRNGIDAALAEAQRIYDELLGSHQALPPAGGLH